VGCVPNTYIASAISTVTSSRLKKVHVELTFDVNEPEPTLRTEGFDEIQFSAFQSQLLNNPARFPHLKTVTIVVLSTSDVNYGDLIAAGNKVFDKLSWLDRCGKLRVYCGRGGREEDGEYIKLYPLK
jgi:hypothetical protein